MYSCSEVLKMYQRSIGGNVLNMNNFFYWILSRYVLENIGQVSISDTCRTPVVGVDHG